MVTIYLQEPFFFLHILRDIDVVDGILQPEFFEGAGDLLAVGGAACISVPISTCHFFAFIGGWG